MARIRAAASSIASGMPSSRRQISLTAAVSAELEFWHERVGTLYEQRNCGRRSPLAEAERRHRPDLLAMRPAAPRGSSRAGDLRAARQYLTRQRAAIALIRCSQLSSTKSRWRPRSAFTTVWSIVLPALLRHAEHARHRVAIAPGSPTAASSTSHTPSASSLTAMKAIDCRRGEASAAVDRKARYAHASDTGERYQARRLQPCEHFAQVPVAAEEPCDLGWQIAQLAGRPRRLRYGSAMRWDGLGNRLDHLVDCPLVGKQTRRSNVDRTI